MVFLFVDPENQYKGDEWIMKQKLLTTLLAVALSAGLLAGCDLAEAEKTIAELAEQGRQAQTEEPAEAADAEADDQAAADAVAALIDKIYVQERTETTDEDCKAAKEAWDALTDAQKELVEGEFADPDYFGRDTGDASKDDPLNQDEIGENEILVVSFGTSFNESRAEDIGGIEKAIQAAFPDWSVRRAFTAQIIINHVQARDEEFIDNMDQALERAVKNNVKNLVVQPTHLMHGAEYDEMIDALEEYADKFDSVIVSEPLLGEVGKDAEEVNADKQTVAKAVVEAAFTEAGYDSDEAADEDKTAFVLMGHGTSHAAKVTYLQMQTQMDELGYKNVKVGTVEGEPEETACENVLDAVKEAGYAKVILRPLMVVAGDHANNDMAGDEEDSWKSMFTASGAFETVDTQIEGLGRIEEVQQIYVNHLEEALKSGKTIGNGKDTASTGELADGTYLAEFETDSTMFKVNETCDGKGVLTVKDGKMTIHVLMPSKNVVNLYPGLAEDAKKDGAVLLDPTVEEVKYEDGLTEEVNAFDVPVPALDEEFDLALIGTKEIWYDHKVSVKDPEPLDESKDALQDGTYQVAVSLEGGSGKATVDSPAKLTVTGGKMIATLTWSSPHYDYMIVDGEKYEPVNTSGNSVFEVPVKVLDEELDMIADTTAMSKPHEVEYKLVFDSRSIK